MDQWDELVSTLLDQEMVLAFEVSATAAIMNTIARTFWSVLTSEFDNNIEAFPHGK